VFTMDAMLVLAGRQIVVKELNLHPAKAFLAKSFKALSILYCM